MVLHTMAQIFRPFLMFPLLLQISSTRSETDFPDYYKISYESSNSTTFSGFYQKQEERYNDKPLFIMPRMNKYLYLAQDGKWTLGTKYTRTNRYTRVLSMKEAGHEVPKSL